MKLFLLILISLPAIAKPFKVKIFSEPAAEDRAREFIKNMKELEPFKQLIDKKALQIESYPTIVMGINCRGGYFGIPRLAQCDLELVKESCGDADLCPVYTSVSDIGAGAQRFPIVSSSFPWTTMLHEVVHTFGFTDEYAYTKKESGIYCPGIMNWQNGHSRNSEEMFTTKELAEKFCKKNISWCELAIASGTQVVQRIDGKYKIGSPTPKSCPDTTLGVYPGGSCQAKNPNTTWRPYFCPTVMGYPSLGEEFCSVTKRHKIIASSPNLLPELYQRQIFKAIAPELQFELRKLPDLSPHTYGLPEIDRLSNENSETNHCLREELINFGDWPHFQ